MLCNFVLKNVVTSQPTVISSQRDSDDAITSENDVMTSSIISNASNVSSATTATLQQSSSAEQSKTGTLNSKDLNLALTQAVGEVTRKVKKGNKFTDGLDLSMTTDWASELRPSMRKLRQAMDGLLKTARLMHSVQRLQQGLNIFTKLKLIIKIRIT